MNPYRPEFDYKYEDTPTTSGVILFVGLLAAIILAAIVWASVSPPEGQPGVSSAPSISEPAAPTAPRTPTPMR